MIKSENSIMVSIICLTYNQKHFLRDCLDGFVSQKTNFRFEAIVHDDASTDGSQDLIREYEEKYPDIIKPIYEKENQYSKHDGSLDRIVNDRCTGKYIALCEGDDFWTDPYKLQKQVDFLESHPDYTMVHTRFNYLYNNDNSIQSDESDHIRIENIINTNPNDIPFHILEDNHYRIQTLTVLYRNHLIDLEEQLRESSLFLMGDTQLWMNLTLYGKVYYLPEVTSVYRVSANSASKASEMRKHLRFSLSCEEMRFYYAKKTNIQVEHFYKRYIRALFKYQIYDPSFKTDVRIVSKNELDRVTRFIEKSGVIHVMTLARPILFLYERLRNQKDHKKWGKK